MAISMTGRQGGAATEPANAGYEPDFLLQPYAIAGAADAPLVHLATALVSAEDRPTRWEPGDRFHHLFDERCRHLGKRRAGKKLAIDYGDVAYSFSDLAARANRLARFLHMHGVRPGDRIGLLMDKSIWSPAAVLALSKLGAAYVPLDAGFPDDRISFILDDSAVKMVLTLGRLTDRLAGGSRPALALDDFETLIALLDPTDFDPEAGDDPDPICYIIYTSGTTGRPKGVPTCHSSIYNFVEVAVDLYGYAETDRVYQGMTIAFDFSVEELWVPLAAGATLVPAPADTQLVGDELHDFLRYNHVTALCCVPTLLATLSADLPDLRLLLVSGEACPPDVIEPWLVPGRRVLNAYGPTETTVTATWSVVEAGGAITIGGPLPTYSVVILDPDEPRPLAPGATGEICLAGVGVVDGYLNRPDETQRAFIDDFIGLPNNPGGTIYRTGDRGRINADKRIEYLGRIDTQVKIRGYRIELDEIAAVAREVDRVAAAVVAPHNPTGNSVELVAYLVASDPHAALDFDDVHTTMRSRLPAYMVPSYYEQLDELPLLPSTKVDRHALPAPRGSRLVAVGDKPHVEPRSELEDRLAVMLAQLIGAERVSVDANFFDELGADSLSLAEFATVIRAELDVRRVTMKRLYQNPSIALLAASIDPHHADEAGATASSSSGAADGFPPAVEVAAATAASEPHVAEPHVPTSLAYAATGVAQTVVFLIATFIAAVASVSSYRWIEGSGGIGELYLRSVLCGTGLFFGGAAALVGVKWLAVGRFTTEPIPLWSTRYLRFWIAKRAIQINPFNLFIGTPAYNAFLRSLGLDVGPTAVVLARSPICVDLVSVGAGTIVREDCHFPGYTAHRGYLFPGHITIGENAVVGEATVLDINTSIGDGSQLGTTSALLEGQHIPARTNYQGSPAVPTATDFDRLPSTEPDRSLRRRYTATQMLTLCLVTTPVGFLATLAVASVGLSAAALTPWSGVAGGVVALAMLGGVVYFGGVLLALVTTIVVPRVLSFFVDDEGPHPLFGTQFRLARGIRTYSNNVLLNTIFGDSSMIVGYLGTIGYDLSRSTQTGSNFGVDQRHHSPFHCSFDRNTLVSDGLRMLNMDISATSFQLRRIDMPADTYLGNLVHYPAASRVGDNCLIATKAAIPIDGPIRTDVGLLGSPAFEIPRSVARDQRFEHFKQRGVLEDRLRHKLRSNLGTLVLYLLRSWALTMWTIAFAIGSFALVAPAGTSDLIRGGAALTLAAALSLMVLPVFSILVERAVRRFQPLQPLYCSLYDARFWNHERFWKLNYNALLRVFDGTPMKPSLVRLQGARIGAKAFDDGSGLTEPTLVEIGDNAMLNFQSAVQCHSLEDGTFKSDRVVIGDSCTLGVGAFVHYGARLGDHSILQADSFLMKGSSIAPLSRWHGNPAREVGSEVSDRPLTQDNLQPDGV